MFCSQCGKMIKDGTRFCGFCGAKTDDAPGTTAPVYGAAPMGSVPQYSQVPQNAAVNSAVYPGQAPYPAQMNQAPVNYGQVPPAPPVPPVPPVPQVPPMPPVQNYPGSQQTSPVNPAAPRPAAPTPAQNPQSSQQAVPQQTSLAKQAAPRPAAPTPVQNPQSSQQAVPQQTSLAKQAAPMPAAPTPAQNPQSSQQAVPQQTSLAKQAVPKPVDSQMPKPIDENDSEGDWDKTVAITNRGRTDTMGNPIDPDAGMPVHTADEKPAEEADPTTEKPKGFRNRKKFIIIGAAAVVGLGAAGAGTAWFLTSRDSVDQLVELGNKYLENGEYDKAIIEFEKAINLDENCVEAYIGIAKAYIGIGNNDAAIKYLQQGFDITGDPEIKKMLDELLGNSSSDGGTTEAGTAEVTVPEPAGASYEIITVAEYPDATGHYNDITGSFQGSGSDMFAVDYNGRYRLATLSGGSSNFIYSYISPFFGSDEQYAFVSTTWDGKRSYSTSQISWIIDRNGDKVMNIPPCYNVWWGSSSDAAIVVQDYGGYRISGIDGKTLCTLPAEFVTETSSIPEFLRSEFKDRSSGHSENSVMTTGCNVFNGEIYFTFTELHDSSAVYYTYKLNLSGSSVSFEKYPVTAETGSPFPVYDDGSTKISAINAGGMLQLVKTTGSSSKFCGCGPTDTDMSIAKVFDGDHVLICRSTSDGVVASTEYAVYKPEWYDSEYETAAQNTGSWTKLSDWYKSITLADNSVWVAETASGSMYLDSNFQVLNSYKQATSFSGGVAIACTGSTGVLVDENSRAVSEEFPCESAEALSDGYFSILSNGKYSIVRAEAMEQ